MISDQRPVIQDAENLPMDGTSQENAHPTNVRAADVNSATAEVDQKSSLNQNTVEKKPVERRINPALTRLVVGGLVGATVGAIAGALTNRKTSQGLKHAAQGIDRASKTVSEGLSHAASGVVDATKSIGEGVGYAISGSTQDAVQGIAEGTQQIKTVAAEVAQTTASQVDRTVKDVTQGVQQAKTATLEAVQATTERVGRAAQEVSDSNQQTIIPVPQTEVTVSTQSDVDIELMNALQADEDFLALTEGTSQEEIEQKIQEDTETALQEGLFADVEISRPSA
jgi:gas vesicle protein